MKLVAEIGIGFFVMTLINLAGHLDWKTGKLPCPIIAWISAILETILGLFDIF
jgi:hypothetical protein